MQYKGFVATYYFARNVSVYVAEIINPPDVITFSAVTLAQLKEEMIVAVDNYMDLCNNSNQERLVSVEV
jgi:predicted HicB family RNase H-like nuclease